MVSTNLVWIVCAVIGAVLIGIPALVLIAVVAALIIAIPIAATVLILLLAVRAKVTLEINEIFSLWVSFLGMKFKLLPKKPKKYNIRDYTPKKIARRDAKAAKRAAKKAEADAKKKAGKAAKKRKKKALKNKMTGAEKRAARAEKRSKIPPVTDMLDLFLEVIQLLTSNFAKRFHFHVLRIRIKVGSEDAAKTALLCSGISIALEPLLIFIDRNSNLHGMKNADIDVSPDYLSEEIKYDVKIAFSMSLGSLIYVLLRAGIPGIVGWTKIQPGSEEKSARNILSSVKNAGQQTANAETAEKAEKS